MISSSESLLRYDPPVQVTEKPGATAPKGSTQPQNTAPAPPLPGNCLHSFLPPREWTEGAQMWVQKVSTAAATRADVVLLSEKLDRMLREKEAKPTGICRRRREIYSQCLDELIRQVSINCEERGSVLVKVREEFNMTLTAFQSLWESSVAFGLRKALLSEQRDVLLEETNKELEKEKQDLLKQVNVEKANCEEIEQREEKRRAALEKHFQEEMIILKTANQQLKDQLESIIRSNYPGSKQEKQD